MVGGTRWAMDWWTAQRAHLRALNSALPPALPCAQRPRAAAAVDRAAAAAVPAAAASSGLPPTTCWSKPSCCTPGRWRGCRCVRACYGACVLSLLLVCLRWIRSSALLLATLQPPPPPTRTRSPCLPVQRKLSDQGVGRDAEWAALLRQPLFSAGAAAGGEEECGGSASLSHLLDIWVERQHLLWKVGGRPGGWVVCRV